MLLLSGNQFQGLFPADIGLANKTASNDTDLWQMNGICSYYRIKVDITFQLGNNEKEVRTLNDSD